MIERKIVRDRMKEFLIEKYIAENLQKVGYSRTKVQKTPLGEKIIIYASRPGLIVGRKGLNIKNLTKNLKNKFKLENPQLEINEIEKADLDAQIVAEKIQSTLERFGSKRFKGVGHKSMGEVMKSGALGCEILITGKIPSSRSKRWRFYQGYLKKSGDVAVSQVNTAYTYAQLKSGTVGIQVRIMLPDTKLPDLVDMKKVEVIEEQDEDGNVVEKTETEISEEPAEQEKDTEEKTAEKETEQKKDTTTSGSTEKQKKESGTGKKDSAKKTTKKEETKTKKSSAKKDKKE